MQENSLFLPSLQTSAYNGLAFSQELDFCVKNQVPAFEIFFDGWMPFELKKSDFDKIFSMKKSGIQFSVHAPIRNYLTDSDFEESLDVIDFCNKFEPCLVTFHFDRLSEPVLVKIRQSLKSNIKLSIEDTIPDKHVLTGETYLEVMKRISKQYDVYATADIGHAFVNGYEPIKFVESLIENDIKIDCFHIHNNDGKRDLHQNLQNGKIDYEKLLNFVFDNRIYAHFVAEHWTDNMKSVDFFYNIYKKFKKNHQ